MGDRGIKRGFEAFVGRIKSLTSSGSSAGQPPASPGQSGAQEQGGAQAQEHQGTQRQGGPMGTLSRFTAWLQMKEKRKKLKNIFGRPQPGAAEFDFLDPPGDTTGSTRLARDRGTGETVARDRGTGETVARDRGTGETVAVRSITKFSLMQTEGRKDNPVTALRREVAVMHLLGAHPNIVTLRELIEDEHHIHLVLDPTAEGNLFEKIANMGAFSERVASRLMRDILQGIALCHARSVVHRDIRPETLVFELGGESLKIDGFSTAMFHVPGGQALTEVTGSLYYIAPEVLGGSYGLECDVWSAGVVLYMMLCGAQPFTGDTEAAVFAQIREANPDYTEDPWQQVSPSAKNLLRAMLDPRPSQRITAAQALEHPWIKGSEAPSSPLGELVVQRIRGVAGANKLKRLALMHIVCNVPTKEIEDLKKIFKMMDRNGDNFISIDELKRGLRKLGSTVPGQELRKLLEAADADGNGLINYVEFLASVVDLSDERRIRTVFAKFDKDGDGSITTEEMKTALQEAGRSFTDADIEKIINDADKDGNGVLDYNEFAEMMRINKSLQF